MGRAEELFDKLRSQGEDAIDEFILVRQSEELFLDFKRSADDGRGPRVLHENDRNNLAKAISGFGNSEGGVIVWGVDARPGIDHADVAQAKKPIENITRFVSWLEGTVSGRTVPAHSQVKQHAIDIGNGTGFVVTLIPKSELAPHQCIFDSAYYMRAGSNFLPVPHSVLAGMFGRRPQPFVFQMYLIQPATATEIPNVSPRTYLIDVNIGFQIGSRGPGLVRDLYSDFRLLYPQNQCSGQFLPMRDDWSHKLHMGIWLSSVTKDGFKLAPESLTHLFNLKLIIAPPFVDKKFWYKWTFGCEGAPINLIEETHTLAEVEALYRNFVNGPKNSEAGIKFVNDLFKLPD